MQKIDTIFQDEVGTDMNVFGLTDVQGNEKIYSLRRMANISQKGTPIESKVLNTIVSNINDLIEESMKISVDLDEGNHTPQSNLKIGGIFLYKLN